MASDPPAPSPRSPSQWTAEELFSVLDQVPEAITQWDASLRLKFANAAAVEFFPRQHREDCLGRTFMQLLPPEVVRRSADDVAAALRGETRTVERRFQRRDGSQRHLHVVFTPYRVHDQLAGFVAVVNDITPRVLIESAAQRRALELSAQAEMLARRANTDHLTGLANRAHLEQLIRQAIAAQRSVDQHLALLLFDLDGFKEINDLHGHAAGDEVLIALAERLRTHVRQPDIIARLGGDEFVILAPQLRTPEQAQHLAQRIVDGIREPITLNNGATVAVTASVGIATTFQTGADTTVASLLASADTLMYRAKARGDGNWEAEP